MANTYTELIVKDDDQSPVAVEVIAENVVAISSGIKKLRSGRLNDKALFLLIQNAAPMMGLSRKIGLSEIKAVFEGIESLERTYLKKT